MRLESELFPRLINFLLLRGHLNFHRESEPLDKKIDCCDTKIVERGHITMEIVTDHGCIGNKGHNITRDYSSPFDFVNFIIINHQSLELPSKYLLPTSSKANLTDLIPVLSILIDSPHSLLGEKLFQKPISSILYLTGPSKAL